MKKVFIAVMVLLVALLGFSPSAGARAGGGHGGGHGGGDYRSGGSRNIGHNPGRIDIHGRGSRVIHGGRANDYSGHSRSYSHRGWVPRGAIVGNFVGGVAIGGVISHFWWPYYAVPVSPYYYAPYYQYPYTAPSYVIAVPPAEATTAYSQSDSESPVATSPAQCYAPKTDTSGNITKDGSGNMIPDFAKPVPCPPQN